MEFIELNTLQAITTRDFPVYSAEVLDWYFEIYQSGNGDDLPPVPLMHTELVLPHLQGTTGTILQKYIRQNPQAEYFLLNGSHRTTAANLTGHIIKGMLPKTEEDIIQARKIKFRGKKYQHGFDDTIIGNIKELVDHFKGVEKFETVQQKTDKMINEKVISEYLIEHYRNIPI